jgi:hypothetical protein
VKGDNEEMGVRELQREAVFDQSRQKSDQIPEETWGKHTSVEFPGEKHWDPFV